MALPKEKYTVADYYKMDFSDKRTELINGSIINMSPSPSIIHQRLSGEISFAIKSYIKGNHGKCVVFEAPTDVMLYNDTIVIPDIFVTCNPENFDKQKYNGAPDWIIEIVSPSNSSHDYINKLYLYKESGVREYWIVDPMEEKVIVYRFSEEKVVHFYNFKDEITVGIYEENKEKLVIKISDLDI